MPRLSQVSRDEAPEGIVTTMYDFIFGDRDPVAEPGLPNGTTGDWWTVVAQSPGAAGPLRRRLPVLPIRAIGSCRRTSAELAQLRVGWARASRFVFSQHCKASRDNGVERGQDPGHRRLGDRRRSTRRPSGPCWPGPTPWCSTAAGPPTPPSPRSASTCRSSPILELTYIACWYDLHAVMSRALKLELDTADDPITEVTGPGITQSLRPDAETGLNPQASALPALQEGGAAGVVEADDVGEVAELLGGGEHGGAGAGLGQVRGDHHVGRRVGQRSQQGPVGDGLLQGVGADAGRGGGPGSSPCTRTTRRCPTG